MSSRATAPFGTWTSPITAQRVAAGTRPLAAPRIVGNDICWLEGLPAEGGRVVVVRAKDGGPGEVVTPAPFNVRSRVHEYGGGAYVVAGAPVYFSPFADKLVYPQRSHAAPPPMTHTRLTRPAPSPL